MTSCIPGRKRPCRPQDRGLGEGGNNGLVAWKGRPHVGQNPVSTPVAQRPRSRAKHRRLGIPTEGWKTAPFPKRPIVRSQPGGAMAAGGSSRRTPMPAMKSERVAVHCKRANAGPNPEGNREDLGTEAGEPRRRRKESQPRGFDLSTAHRTATDDRVNIYRPPFHQNSPGFPNPDRTASPNAGKTPTTGKFPQSTCSLTPITPVPASAAPAGVGAGITAHSTSARGNTRHATPTCRRESALSWERLCHAG